jgi:flagellar hook assembly protein FlgD
MQIEFAMSENRSASLPAQVMLGRAHPNPFNPSTTLSFSIPTGPTRDFSLRIYDVRGRMVRELDSGQIDAGQHERVWNGLDDRGSSVASGIYHYRLEVGGESFSNKMVLVK